MGYVVLRNDPKKFHDMERARRDSTSCHTAIVENGANEIVESYSCLGEALFRHPGYEVCEHCIPNKERLHCPLLKSLHVKADEHDGKADEHDLEIMQSVMRTHTTAFENNQDQKTTIERASAEGTELTIITFLTSIALAIIPLFVEDSYNALFLPVYLQKVAKDLHLQFVPILSFFFVLTWVYYTVTIRPGFERKLKSGDVVGKRVVFWLSMLLSCYICYLMMRLFAFFITSIILLMAAALTDVLLKKIEENVRENEMVLHMSKTSN